YETAGQSPTFSAAGLQPGTTRTIRVRAMDGRGAYAVASTTITITAPPPPPPSFCSPRPRVAVTTTRGAPGELTATIAAQTSAATGTNSLSSLRIDSAVNASVQVNGGPVAVGQTVTLPANSQQATLLIQRSAPGGASTVSFAVADACGEWKSFVGGGTGAF